MRARHRAKLIFDQNNLMARFWQSASLFWREERPRTVILAVLLVSLVLLQLLVQFLLNRWNRNFFNALEGKDADTLWTEAKLFMPLAAASMLLAAASVWGRMTTQRSWRESLTRHILDIWLDKDRFRHLDELIKGAENPEYRIAVDIRVATDAPVDLTLALITSLLTAMTFFGVLWETGGSIELVLFGFTITIPGYLVFGVIIYSGLVSALMVFSGHYLTGITERTNQAEAEFRAAVDTFHEQAEHPEPERSDEDKRQTAQLKLQAVLLWWREFCWQLVHTTVVSHGSVLFAPVVGWFLCVPKYLDGAMSLGELTQSAAAFVVVQSAFNWLVDNYQRLADWRSSAHRVATLLVALDELKAKEGSNGPPS